MPSMFVTTFSYVIDSTYKTVHTCDFVKIYEVTRYAYRHSAAFSGRRVALNQSLNELRMWANANVMAALPNIGGALCSTPQSLADAHY